MAKDDKNKEVETDISKLKCWGRVQNQQIAHILITPTFRCAMICYLILAIILGGFGVLCFMQARQNNDFLIRYDDKCSGLTTCSVTFQPTSDLVNPKIYYQLDNFYANHRNFVKSRNYKQLRGNVLGSSDLSSCDPVITMKDLGDSISKVALDGTTLKNDDIAYPCGLIAKYFFNDTYQLAETSSGTNITIDETDIAHKVDKEYKFKLPQNSNPKSTAWLDVSNEHVMVWYQMESFPNFIKLWGHIDQTLYSTKNYTIVINNKFDVEEFDGKKYIYLSEVNSLGGTNNFLGIAFLAMAGAVIFIMLIFIILYFVRNPNKQLNSIDNLQW